MACNAPRIIRGSMHYRFKPIKGLAKGENASALANVKKFPLHPVVGDVGAFGKVGREVEIHGLSWNGISL